MISMDHLLSQQYEISLNLVLRPFGDFCLCTYTPILISIRSMYNAKI